MVRASEHKKGWPQNHFQHHHNRHRFVTMAHDDYALTRSLSHYAALSYLHGRELTENMKLLYFRMEGSAAQEEGLMSEVIKQTTYNDMDNDRTALNLDLDENYQHVPMSVTKEKYTAL